MGRAVIPILALAWAALFAMSVVSALTIAPEGDGFTRGLNRFGAVLAWQGAAFAAALALLFAGRGAPQLRWLTRTPFAIHVLIIVGAGALTAYLLFAA